MMTGEAQQLQRGTVVIWNNDPHDQGTVQRLSSTGFYVAWENGQEGWIDYRDATMIETRANPPPAGE